MAKVKEIDISKNYKIGDRVFFEYYGFDENKNLVPTGIGTSIIVDIKDDFYEDLSTRKDFRDKGTIVHYKMLFTTGDSMIEDYNCIPEDDPRVVEFVNGRTLVKPSFIDDLRKWLTDNGAMPGDRTVADILYTLYKEYEQSCK